MHCQAHGVQRRRRIDASLGVTRDFPGGADGKQSVCNAGDPGFNPWVRNPGEGDGNPLQYSCWGIPWTEELVGYSPWGGKELDMTK